MIETQVIDNFLPAKLADEIENTVFSADFPWYFIKDITYGNAPHEGQNTPAFSHFLMSNDGAISKFFVPYASLPFFGNYGVPPSRIVRAISILQMPTNQESTSNNIHVDFDAPHVVFLYYVNDADGDTTMYSRDKNDRTPSKIITPKKNRAVIFDGSIYHSSSRPSKTERCIINFNLSPFESTK